MVLGPGTPEGSTGSCSGFKASQKTGQQLKVSSDRLGEAKIHNYVLINRYIDKFSAHNIDYELELQPRDNIFIC